MEAQHCRVQAKSSKWKEKSWWDEIAAFRICLFVSQSPILIACLFILSFAISFVIVFVEIATADFSQSSINTVVCIRIFCVFSWRTYGGPQLVGSPQSVGSHLGGWSLVRRVHSLSPARNVRLKFISCHEWLRFVGRFDDDFATRPRRRGEYAYVLFKKMVKIIESCTKYVENERDRTKRVRETETWRLILLFFPRRFALGSK